MAMPVVENFVSRSPLIALADGVAAYFARMGLDHAVLFGWKEREKQINQGAGGANRVVFMPGAKGGTGTAKGGTLSRDNQPTREENAQVVATRASICTVSIWAVNADSAGALYSEREQFQALDSLYTDTIVAIHAAIDPDTGEAAGLGAIEWGDFDWTTPPVNVAFGRELLQQFTQFSAVEAPRLSIARPQIALHRGKT
jgi:hypothetical protein